MRELIVVAGIAGMLTAGLYFSTGMNSVDEMNREVCSASSRALAESDQTDESIPPAPALPSDPTALEAIEPTTGMTWAQIMTRTR